MGSLDGVEVHLQICECRKLGSWTPRQIGGESRSTTLHLLFLGSQSKTWCRNPSVIVRNSDRLDDSLPLRECGHLIPGSDTDSANADQPGPGLLIL